MNKPTTLTEKQSEELTKLLRLKEAIRQEPMKNRVMNFLAKMHTINVVPPRLTNNSPAIFHIGSGQVFSLLEGEDFLEPDEMPSFTAPDPQGGLIILPPHKVIKFLLIDYAKATALEDGTNETTEYLHIKNHLLHKTGFLL